MGFQSRECLSLNPNTPVPSCVILHHLPNRIFSYFSPLESTLRACRVHVKLLQSPLTLRNPMNHSPPGSSVHGTLQASILEGLRGSFQHRY